MTGAGYTASGGATALDMMLEWIGALEGEDDGARQVADTLVHKPPRSDNPLEARISRGSPLRHRTMTASNSSYKAMETHLEDVLQIDQLAVPLAACFTTPDGAAVQALSRDVLQCGSICDCGLSEPSSCSTYTRMSVRDVGLGVRVFIPGAVFTDSTGLISACRPARMRKAAA